MDKIKGPTFNILFHLAACHIIEVKWVGNGLQAADMLHDI